MRQRKNRFRSIEIEDQKSNRRKLYRLDSYSYRHPDLAFLSSTDYLLCNQREKKVKCGYLNPKLRETFTYETCYFTFNMVHISNIQNFNDVQTFLKGRRAP